MKRITAIEALQIQISRPFRVIDQTQTINLLNDIGDFVLSPMN
jgi:hypothetical protein